MQVRIWRVKVKAERVDDLEEFARKVSQPMFKDQTGCLGVLFTRRGNDCATITFWEDPEAIERLGTSRSYQETVDKIEESGMLEGEHTVEVFEAFGGFLKLDKIF